MFIIGLEKRQVVYEIVEKCKDLHLMLELFESWTILNLVLVKTKSCEKRPLNFRPYEN